MEGVESVSIVAVFDGVPHVGKQAAKPVVTE